MTRLAEVEAAATALTPEERDRLESVLRELRQKEHDAYMQSLYERAESLRTHGIFPAAKAARWQAGDHGDGARTL